jgi:hypothetical protein
MIIIGLEAILSRINKILGLEEQILKQQRIDAPLGNLYLTNTRILFIRLGKFLGSDTSITLSDIQNVTKSMSYLKIRADKEYNFMCNPWSISDWITEIKKAQQELIWKNEPGLTPSQPITRTPPKSSSHYCPQCNRPVIYVPKYSRYYCNNCQRYVNKQ